MKPEHVPIECAEATWADSLAKVKTWRGTSIPRGRSRLAAQMYAQLIEHLKGEVDVSA